MTSVDLASVLQPGQIVLAVSAHCDDVMLGAAGLIGRLRTKLGNELTVESVVYTGGNDAARANEERKACAALGIASPEILNFPDTRVPEHAHAIKEHLLALRERFRGRIAVVLSPTLEDRHQDHRTIAEIIPRVFRKNELILEYEIFKFEGDVGRPNVYVTLTPDEADRKLTMLMESYSSRNVHHWWKRETLAAPMRLRGLECNSEFAEAFTARKLIW